MALIRLPQNFSCINRNAYANRRNKVLEVVSYSVVALRSNMYDRDMGRMVRLSGMDWYDLAADK